MPMFHSPARSSGSSAETTAAGSSSTPWNSSPTVRSKASRAGHAASDVERGRHLVGRLPAPVLVDGQHHDVHEHSS